MPHKVNGSPPAKKRRIITACVECYRRKQKCDRKQPCNICSARKVECTYLDPEEAQNVKSHQSAVLDQMDTSHKRKREDDDCLIDESLKNPDLSSMTGYSARNDSNSLVSLRKSLYLGQAPRTKSQKSMLMSYLKDKYLGLTSSLPKEDIVNQLVKVFFEEANSHAGVLEQYFFGKTYRSWKTAIAEAKQDIRLEALPRDLLYFPAVLFQVLAVALQYIGLDSVTAHTLAVSSWSELDALSLKYTQLGTDVMKLLGRHSPTVTSVQHDLMRSFWLKNASRGTESWYNLGDAIRQAQDLGLHLKGEIPQGKTVEETLENLWFDELRKRLWVSLFNWDAHMCMVLGRPRSINAADCTVAAPLDCDMPVSPPTTVPATAATSQEPSAYIRHLFNNYISHKAHEMLSLGANRRYVKDYGVVRKLHQDVLAKVQDLPPTARPNNTDYSWDTRFPYLVKNREHILTFANSFLIALHRPHAATHNESFYAAIQASLEVLGSQQRLFAVSSTSQHGTFGMSFYTNDAALFLSTAILENPIVDDDDLRIRVDEALAQAIHRLNVMKARSPMAEHGALILTKCVEASQLQREQNNSQSDPDYPKYPSTTGTMQTPSTHTTASFDLSPPKTQAALPNEPKDPAAVDWNLPDDDSTLDMIGNMTDFNASFWTDQMSQILNANSLPSEEDFSWAFFPG